MQTIKIIEGKRYNTETATKIAEYWNRLSPSDFHSVTETLYRTPKGQFFMVGVGGALTRYAQSCGNNSWCGGSQWQVFTDDEAFEWLQSYGETDALESFFPNKIQDA
jgi:hypothetical protein